jgi:NAD-dependent dihydropyrimidine dehydrogenase PreA subunit
MRKIIKIDESLCNGCGECITACAEGAIELEDGKARVVSDSFCDGLGACLAVCPQGALTIEEREAEEFDEKAAKEHLSAAGPTGLSGKHGHKGQSEGDDTLRPCTVPVTLKRSMDKPATGLMNNEKHKMAKKGEPGENELCGWPIQMRLVRPWASYLQGASLLVAGDCTAFAYPDIQQEFIKGRVALVGCPKLDDTGPFVDKLADILKANEIKDITVLHMTVPCCSQLEGLVAEAVQRSGKRVPQKSHVVGIDGKLIK